MAGQGSNVTIILTTRLSNISSTKIINIPRLALPPRKPNMGFIPPHMLKAKAASQDVSAEEREASRKTMEMDAARQAQREDGEKGKASGGGSSAEVKGEQKKGEEGEKK
ncbi:hypothetical protein CNYM01_08940 [Colletotrichum nymphaeae SA-01]|uniref:Uncharacterized protein n=1 Tax=Colletotrichum nymphaeae SA-01 TaxID=1460502 RepID=A0A135TJM4_9PEZI|nr:hypothetical protein CNYM01_08940 [Colletotrichum nymphaeae SA-01]